MVSNSPDLVSLGTDYGTLVGFMNAEASSLGLDAGSNCVNTINIFTPAVNIGSTNPTGSTGSIYDGLFTPGTNTDSYNPPATTNGTNGTNGTSTPTAAQNNDMMAQIAKIFETFMAFLMQFLNQQGAVNNNSPLDGNPPAITAAPIDSAPSTGGTTPAEGTTSADGTTVVYNGEEVSKAKMDEVEDVLKGENRNVNLRKFEHLAKVIDDLVSEKSFITTNDANTLTTTLTGLTNAEYIAFQKYFNEETGDNLESVIRSLEGKGLDAKQTMQLMEKADAAQVWLMEVDETEDSAGTKDTKKTKEADGDTVIYNGEEVSKAKMDEVDALLKKNTIKVEFAKLKQELDQLIDTGLDANSPEKGAQEFVDKLTGMDDVKYIAFQKYCKERSVDLEKVFANLEGKNGVSSEMVYSLMERSDDAQDWLMGKKDAVTDTSVNYKEDYTLRSITQDDVKDLSPEERKIIDHLFKNEEWLGTAQEGSNHQANGTLEVEELLTFIARFDKDDTGVITEEAFENWKNENIAAGNEAHKDFEYQDLLNFLNIFKNDNE